MGSPAAILAQTALFSGLAPAVIEELAAHTERRQAPAGTAIFAEGDTATGFYMVSAGRVRVYKASADGKEQTLHIFGPGQALGEAAVFSGGIFPAHAEALEASTLLYLPRDAFLDFICSHPEAALDMLGLMSRRLMRFATMIENLSLKEAPARLAAYLLHLAQKQQSDQVELDTNKSQLAAILGTTPETLSRVLTRLTREGAIAQVEGRRITLADKGMLQAVSEGERRLS